MGLKSPVLFLIFNRLAVTRSSFAAIRSAKPTKLYIACDGPRAEVLAEDTRVKEVRDYVMGNIDWPCKVETLFRESNLGCKLAVSGAISWFFSSVERGIIVEDDCVPSRTFFNFCDLLLEKYAHDDRVWHIGGTSTIGPRASSVSYYFSKYNHIWGWATWRRAWEHYDVDMSLYDEREADDIISDVTGSSSIRQIWKRNFAGAASGRINTWDYQWYYCVWYNGGLSILPYVNLVSNIGFSPDATHTKDPSNRLACLERGELDQIYHPRRMARSRALDDANAYKLFHSSLADRARGLLLRTVRYVRRITRSSRII